MLKNKEQISKLEKRKIFDRIYVCWQARVWWLEVRKKVQDYGIAQDDVRMLCECGG